MKTTPNKLPARGAHSGNPRSPISHKASNGLSDPLVGLPWPELNREDVHWPDCNGTHVQYIKRTRKSESVKVFSVRVSFKTRALLIALFVIIVGYAVLRNDRAIIIDVLKTFEVHAKDVPASESPPSQEQ